jgi:Co/Zn/Cd efflux system component
MPWNQGNSRVIWIVLMLTCGSSGLELLVGSWGHHQPLFLEAQHLAIDSGILLILANFDQLSTLFPQWKTSRLQAIVSLVNVLGLASGILRSTLETWVMPTVHWSAPLAAMVGLITSYISIRLLSADRSPDLNQQGILLHINADLVSATGTLLVTAISYLWPHDWIDRTGSLLIALIIGIHALPLIYSSYQQLVDDWQWTNFSSKTGSLGPDGKFHSLTAVVLGTK